jgi:hypothetical protein
MDICATYLGLKDLLEHILDIPFLLDTVHAKPYDLVGQTTPTPFGTFQITWSFGGTWSRFYLAE